MAAAEDVGTKQEAQGHDCRGLAQTSSLPVSEPLRLSSVSRPSVALRPMGRLLAGARRDVSTDRLVRRELPPLAVPSSRRASAEDLTLLKTSSSSGTCDVESALDEETRRIGTEEAKLPDRPQAESTVQSCGGVKPADRDVWRIAEVEWVVCGSTGRGERMPSVESWRMRKYLRGRKRCRKEARCDSCGGGKTAVVGVAEGDEGLPGVEPAIASVSFKRMLTLFARDLLRERKM